MFEKVDEEAQMTATTLSELSQVVKKCLEETKWSRKVKWSDKNRKRGTLEEKRGVKWKRRAVKGILNMRRCQNYIFPHMVFHQNYLNYYNFPWQISWPAYLNEFLRPLCGLVFW